MTRTIDDILAAASVIPVMEAAQAEDGGPLAEALLEGGVRVAELTLRTPAALDALAAMKRAAPGLIVGMGTVLTVDDAERALARGADFLVSPGLTPALLEFAARSGAPFLPGVATASEVMRALEAGVSRLKFFPAEPAGGAAYLKALYGPIPAAVFCPTGGIGPEQAADYLALPNVACVGGSWIAPAKAIEARDWAAIAANARRAAALKAR
ncbi:bifunctional 4-hydroxy-2-oxoglutarate aldolase/2-dehydro-3-deoxy-phosphogluconate aldolase [Amphiplicatus metriothermophilus]|uniref:2-dehydro-3-deoxy-phosphogluconate aldolase n=1 Tax=Amphiplicatus metriothermophilus TaxID=1519374 RepID=A0A239PY50_9PROT|nr:bifunctional 4-hydroxy-2-oxoglutarate aldolase/2-dehydro-3-deoxy-phosphogluconate aldolase [Amphiplicatus metriothermophilus]MBB5519761.1 2-dehydro-3-deoxyphosphogluconate aldolase/(4S)-4-hydroxy-2-oxoglutarate aldolase [Amphiplicatus metriothermophilus]SNT75241.1 2-dehydro-3-deoxyphosphogluconate aldolase / (4S)-4-hydroxy-2-oxoglutarate aldolase [Amphiplicatus metriothermophilus]